MTFGTFANGVNPIDDEELLLKITEDVQGESNPVLDKTTFNFNNNELSFSREVNDDREDLDINHAVDPSQLDHYHTESWTEALFYGRGNQAM